jgi:predicted  nucleic acid-binding Zn-ribbon protein
MKNFFEVFEEKSPGLKERVFAVKDQVDVAYNFLPGYVAEQYRRLVQVHGADALASVDNKSCSNCYLTLTQQMMVELKSGKLRFCKSCGRLLYLPEKV